MEKPDLSLIDCAKDVPVGLFVSGYGTSDTVQLYMLLTNLQSVQNLPLFLEFLVVLADDVTYPRMRAWKLAMIFDSRSSLMSSSMPSTPARKKTLVCPSRYLFWSKARANTFSVTTLPSTNPAGIAFGVRMEYLSATKHTS